MVERGGCAWRLGSGAELRPLALTDGTELQGLIEANLYNKRVKEFEQARAFVAAEGLDPDIHGPIAPEPPPAVK